jgi:hypothetical protein
MARRQASPGLRLLMLIGVCLTLISVLPAAPARAGAERNQDVDNTLDQFDDGSFQMTASANYPSGTPQTGDIIGATQMAPIAVIDNMTSITTLPNPRADAGVVTVGRNIFAIGGVVGSAASDTVISSQVDTANGGLAAWQTEPALLSVPHSSRTNSSQNAAVSPRTLPAVASYATDQDNGFIYVVGGQVSVGGFQISSASVLRGTVVAGRITGWTSMPSLPSPRDIPAPITSVEGLLSASATIATLPNGDRYLYVFGGLQRYKQPVVPITEAGSRYIFSARILSDGSFSAWSSTVVNIPLNPAFGVSAGLWSSPVIGGSLRDANGQSFISYYLMGGRYSTASVTSEVYRIDVNATDGSLDVGQKSGVGTNDASTGAARTGHAAIQFNGSVYVAGGITSGSTPTRDVLGSYVQTDRRFPDLDASAGETYFISKATGLPEARSGHGLVVVPAAFTGATKAYVYMIGGNPGTSSSSDTIFRVTIGDPNDTTVSYPLEAYYISKPVQFVASNARLKRIFWAADIPAGANIEMSYRLSNDTNCADLGTRTELEVPWITTSTATFDSSTNLYNFLLTSELANCFQYRARLTPTNQSSNNATPYLNRVGIVIEVPGATDLTVKSVDLTRSPTQQITGFNIVLHNENIFIANEPTLPADFGPDGPGSAPGSFFVDIFIYPPGVTPPPSHEPPTSASAYAAVSLDIFRYELQVGPGGTGFDFTIPADRPLCDYNARSTPPNYACIPRTMKSLFPAAGLYQIVVVVDGNNNVTENPTDAGQAESNNVFGPQNFTVAEGSVPSGATIYLPMIVKP